MNMVTCHLYLCQNGRDLLRATAVTRWAEQTPNKSLDKKILQPFLPGFELATSRSWVRRSYQQAIPAMENSETEASIADSTKSFDMKGPGIA